VRGTIQRQKHGYVDKKVDRQNEGKLEGGKINRKNGRSGIENRLE
jgi:hypothetical protein